jgi:hypothetical protein
MERVIGILLVVSAVMTLYFSFFNSAKIFIG